MIGFDPFVRGDAHLREQPLSRETVLRGHFLHVVHEKVSVPGDVVSVREFVIHEGAAMVVPLLDDGRVLMEYQYRRAMGQGLLEFPAGKLDAGETGWHCAQRELEEETGYTAAEWAYACEIAPTCAYSTERIQVWFARGLRLGTRRLDEGELLDVLAVTPAQLDAWCQQGKVLDAKTQVGALWLQNWLAGRWSLTWKVPEACRDAR